MAVPTPNLLSSPRATLQTDSLLNASLLAITWDSGPALSSDPSPRRGSFAAEGDWAVKWTDPSSSSPISLTPLSLQPSAHPGFPRRLEEERKGGLILGGEVGMVGEMEMVRRSGTQTSADYARLFSSRAVVQAPSKITPVSEKGVKSSYAVYFLLNKNHASPASVVVEYTPQVWSPDAKPLVSEEIVVQRAEASSEHLTAWANARLEDLKALAAIARELQTSGSRNDGTGLIKRGVEGMGMDMRAIEEESKMVHEEMNWVRELLAAVAREGIFTGYGIGEASAEDPTVEEEREAIERALKEMSILAEEMKVRRSSISSPVTHAQRIIKGPALNTALAVERQKFLLSKPQLHTPDSQAHPSPTDANDDTGLFAVPLSPRSPEMPVSPFSLLKGLPDRLFDSAQTNKSSPLAQPPTLSPTSTTALTGLHPIHPSGGRSNIPQPLRIPVGGGYREELAGIVVRSPREPTTPTLAGMPNPEELRRKRNWGAERVGS